ncbi:unnamed protein product [Mycena citricolor]|uniref:BTB domain-containing protein n=1 Tax=Mycena citricolor TaxID=2018698 RepID=A0AAD2HY22_9AGAR|nr:unnamed protein product [Mycena citricolor]
MSPKSTHQATIEKASTYYLEPIVFLVENTLFKVPRYQFENKSGVFGTAFSIPSPDGEGSSDENPVKLEGIASKDFDALLTVLYPLSSLPTTPVLSADQWISVLKLANMWLFEQARELAIRQLESHSKTVDPIQRVLLGRRYDVSAWMRSGYTDIASRKESMSMDEARELGLDATWQISQLREARVAQHTLLIQHSNLYRNIDIANAFEAELRRADEAHRSLPPPPLELKPATFVVPPTSSSVLGQPLTTSERHPVFGQASFPTARSLTPSSRNSSDIGGFTAYTLVAPLAFGQTPVSQGPSSSSTG